MITHQSESQATQIVESSTPRLGRIARQLLVASLLANAVVCALAAYIVYRRGGTEYLEKRFSGNILSPARVHWIRRQSLFQRLQSVPERPAHPIVFLGDSITELGEWDEIVGGRGAIVNRGIGADTSRGVLDRIETSAAMRPRAVFLMIGTNDASFLQPKETVQNCRLIVERIGTESPSTMVYVQSVLPTGGPWQSRNAWIRDVNAGLKAMADGTRVVYIDLYQSFLDKGTLNAKLSFDGVHLNGDGYDLWYNLLLPLVRSQLAVASPSVHPPRPASAGAPLR